MNRKFYDLIKNITLTIDKKKMIKRYERSFPKYADELKRNQHFRDMHKGQTCFILGNGPSLNDVDFSLLSKEVTFTVNWLTRHPKYSELKANYHFFTCENLFVTDDSNDRTIELINMFKEVNSGGSKPTVFFDYKAHDMVEKYRLMEDININYISLCGVEFNTFIRNNKIDITGIIPDFQTVVQAAVCVAVYMGFKKIVLLGCDSTDFLNYVKKTGDEGIEDQYAYKMEKIDKDMIEELKNDYTNAHILSSASRLLMGYYNLYNFCDKIGVELINATKNSLIDCVPYLSLENILL